jgi:two-component system CheB/CheR fusion protein
VGRSIEAFAHKLAYPTFADDVRRVLESGKPIDRDVETLDERSYYLRIIPYRKNNTIAGVVVTLLDMAAMRAAERNSRLLATIVESSLDAVIATDPGGKITHWNRGAERLYGWTAQEILHRSYETLVPAERTPELAQLLARVRRGEAADRVESVRRRKDGSLVDVSQTVAPILGRLGEVAGMSTIERDITPQKRTEEEIREAVKHREQFLAVLSHELRNPMAAVTNAARVLRDPNAEEALRGRAVTVLERQTSHMSRLLDDLLDISRIRQGKLQLRNESLDLRQVAEAAIETAGPTLSERGVRLVVEGASDALPLTGDPHRLRQMMVNLLTNAARHSASGQKVWLTLGRQGERAVLRVRDEGDGIEPAQVSRLFQAFATGDSKGQRAEGLGIGLWLVRSIAEAHGGSVTGRSDGAGQGSEFLVDLPLVMGEWRAPATDSQNPLAGEVLIVEDQTDTRDLLEAILAGAGLSVRAAGSGERALELAAERLPQVAVVDIGLPGISGLEVARRLRASYPAGRLRLVALTGFGQQSDRQEVFEAGFDQHLVKPVDIDLLLHVLRGELKVHASQMQPSPA